MEKVAKQRSKLLKKYFKQSKYYPNLNAILS